MDIKTIKEKTAPILANNHVARASVFGSTVRGEASPKSDVDILVHFDKPISLMDMGGLQVELSEALKTSVDLVTELSLHPKIKDTIIRDSQVIYER